MHEEFHARNLSNFRAKQPKTSKIRRSSSASSTRTRIETVQIFCYNRGSLLRALHPREQGLKPIHRGGCRDDVRLRALHPREQGLKLIFSFCSIGHSFLRALHPREQGLKQVVLAVLAVVAVLRALHPREQGLKPVLSDACVIDEVFERFIHENKD